MAAVADINATGGAAGPARKVLLLHHRLGAKGPADKVMERLAHGPEMPERRPA